MSPHVPWRNLLATHHISKEMFFEEVTLFSAWLRAQASLKMSETITKSNVYVHMSVQVYIRIYKNSLLTFGSYLKTASGHPLLWVYASPFKNSPLPFRREPLQARAGA